MPTTFAKFKEEVLALYEAKKNSHELDDLLVNPSPAKLRDYCLVRLSEGLPPEDIEILQKFFDPYKKEKSLEEAIAKYNTGSLKALQKFALNITQDPEDRVVKLLAILVDYQPRPFRYSYDNSTLDGPKNPSPIDEEKSSSLTDELDAPLFPTVGKDPTSEGSQMSTTLTDEKKELQDKPEEEKAEELIDDIDVQNDSNEMGKNRENIERFKYSRPFFKKNKLVLRFSGVALLVLAILTTVHFLTPEDCMCWNGKKYIEVDCQSKTQPYQVIGLDKNKLEGFVKITRPDTLGPKDVGRVWYSKINHEVEFFTGPGYHPTEFGRSLKAATMRILDSYAGANAKSDQNKKYGIMQKQ
ncbi:hypothetical protein [Sphingobacterium sp.]|uniref:hypothetical protein n=1 Tax=Sphingobacterium sp. TaxID=341027 RepID=UPI0031D4F759